jgi:hypothetical protein
MIVTRRRHHRSGQAMVEFALSIPVLILVICGLIELGFMINARMVLEDTVRQAAHYGSVGGTIDGSSDSVAPDNGCLADAAILQDISDRLSGTTIDTTHVRSIFIYAGDTADGTDLPRMPYASGTGLESPTTYPNAGLVGDYYYADYNPSNGQDIDDSGASPATPATQTGTGKGAVYKLFHNDIADVFSQNPVSPAGTPPACGSAINQSDSSGTHACFPYADNSSTGTLDAGCVIAGGVGNWPPDWRNNVTDKVSATTNEADAFGVDITYDYQFHTPLFQVISNMLLGNSHVIRMSEHAVFIMSPA